MNKKESYEFSGEAMCIKNDFPYLSQYEVGKTYRFTNGIENKYHFCLLCVNTCDCTLGHLVMPHKVDIIFRAIKTFEATKTIDKGWYEEEREININLDLFIETFNITSDTTIEELCECLKELDLDVKQETELIDTIKDFIKQKENNND